MADVAVRAGTDDLTRAAEALAARLPEPLRPLAKLAYNLRWSWHAEGHALYEAVDPQRWARCRHNPVKLLQEVSWPALERAAGDAGLLDRLERVEREVDEDLARPGTGPVTDEHPAAFFCAEFGIHESLPIYSGGLGALAGDILKEASDRALPFVAVGLLYRQGYFQQRVDLTGWQQESWVDVDPERSAMALVTGDDGQPLTVTVPIHGRPVVAQCWRVDVGRVALYLLDADRPENDRLSRWITGQLYVGDPDTRLAQYVLLGVGGARMLAAMGIEPGVVHLNEGHASFAALELGGGLGGATDRTIFTTHTPVPAGNDAYPADQVAGALSGYAEETGVDLNEVLRLGRTSMDEEHEPFGVTQFALRTSRAANGVSARHGGVAREMWAALWPDRPLDDVPIGHVTNGVHVPSWVGGPMREMLCRHLGADWMTRAADPATWEGVDAIPDEELWAARNAQRATLVERLRERTALDRLQRGEDRDYVELATRAFDPDVLTLGFARRLATYKRLDLLLRDPERGLALLAGDRPVQLVIAGKAHPRDTPGKELIKALLSLRGRPHVGERIVFLHDYDLEVARWLVQGCDVWVNLPRPPLEASGTSGMKSAVNGGLQLSVLDGWWPEAYNGSNGWAISGEPDADHGAQDARDSAELYRLIEEEVVPEFHDRRHDGIPRAWLARVRASLKTVGPGFAAGRMLADYETKFYT